MTFLEKAMENDKADGHDNTKNDIINNCCPSDYDLEAIRDCGVSIPDSRCEKCWNREMPNTEPQFSNPVIEKAYNTGLNDAWELLSKLYDFTCDELLDIFDLKNGFYDVIRNYTPQEAIAKLKAYEEAQIEVGDVVRINNSKFTYVVTLIQKAPNETFYCGISEEGKWITQNNVTKTGRKVEIKAILEQIGE